REHSSGVIVCMTCLLPSTPRGDRGRGHVPSEALSPEGGVRRDSLSSSDYLHRKKGGPVGLAYPTPSSTSRTPRGCIPVLVNAAIREPEAQARANGRSP